VCFFGVESSDADLKDSLQTLVGRGQMHTAAMVDSAVRLPQRQRGAGEQAPSKPRPDICRFANVADKTLVLKARTKLRGSNVRVQENFTRLQRKHHNACWAAFVKAKEEKKKVFWTAEKLFIDGKEHNPAAA